jgi:class 3 adenylate cyclase
MAETTIRTLVCSVMFLDIVDYSKRSVGDQQHMKQTFNEFLARALEPVPPRDFIVLDTGDGAAIAFLGDPEDALSAGIAVRKSIASLPPEMLSARMGINLGPVRLVWDINAQMNILGDGINVAQRVMSFAKPGQLLASRSFYEVVSRLSRDYASLFSDLGTRTDKHVREHEVYAVAEGARLERSADAPRRSRSTRASDPDETNLDLFSTEDSPIVEHGAKKARREKSTAEPARIFEAGANLIVSGSSKAAVEQALERLSKGGAEVISHITQVGDKWMASCTNPKVNVAACKVEVAGLMRIITGPTREAVDEKVRDLVQFGAVLVSDIELNDGVWTAVCDTGGRSR